MTETDERKVPGWRQPWDAWRLTMMGGALILLGAALARGLFDMPRAAEIALQTIGYVVLAVGFGMAMRVRKALQDKRKKEAEEKARARRRETGLR